MLFSRTIHSGESMSKWLKQKERTVRTFVLLILILRAGGGEIKTLFNHLRSLKNFDFSVNLKIAKLKEETLHELHFLVMS